MSNLEDIAGRVLELSRSKGADHAEVYLREGRENEIEVRNGKVDRVSSGQPRSVSLRVWIGDKVAGTYGTDLSNDGLVRLVDQALEIAPLLDPTPEAALADAATMAREFPDLQLADPHADVLSVDEKISRAQQAEELAMAADPAITVSGGASWSDGAMSSVLADTRGFVGRRDETWVSSHVEVIADDENHRKRNGAWYSVARFLEDLERPEEIAAIAADRALRQRGAGPIATEKLPVVFDPYMAASLWSAFFGAISGAAIERGSSYLQESLDQQVASPLVTLIDDPFLARGLGSRPFDGEGAQVRKTAFIEDGTLKSFALNSYHARRLKMKPTGHASRPTQGAPGEAPSNLYVAPGSASPQEIIAGVKRGFYCQSMMGFGFNAVTGDFSRGASGFLIEDGKLTRPVTEVTLSSNYKEMLNAIDAVGSDLRHDRAVCSPTIRVAAMTLGGT